MKKIFATSVFAMAALSANAAPLVTIGDQLDIFSGAQSPAAGTAT